MITLNWRGVKFSVGLQTLTQKQSRERQSLQSLRFTAGVWIQRQNLPASLLLQGEISQWFLSFTSGITTSVSFQTFTFLSFIQVLKDENSSGEWTQKGRMQDYAFSFASSPSYSYVCEIQALNREADDFMLILFSFVFILAFNKHSICTNCVPSSVFSSKYIRLKSKWLMPSTSSCYERRKTGVDQGQLNWVNLCDQDDPPVLRSGIPSNLRWGHNIR